MTHDDFLDPGTAERLLDGSVAPADAPPGFGPVAELLDAARGGVTPPPADLGVLASAARAGAEGTAASEPQTPGRPPMLAKILTLKAAAVAGVVLLGATSAAAATGALPGPLQRTAHDTLSHVGVTVPSDDDDAADATEAKHDGSEDEDVTATSTTVPGDPTALPPAVPTSTPETSDDDGTEVEDESGDDQGQDVADDQAEDDDHDGTTATTQPSSGSGSQDSGEDHEDEDNSGPGSSSSGSSGHGDGED